MNTQARTFWLGIAVIAAISLVAGLWAYSAWLEYYR